MLTKGCVDYDLFAQYNCRCGDAIFGLMQNEKSYNGYPFHLFGGLVESINHESNGKIVVDQFEYLSKISSGLDKFWGSSSAKNGIVWGNQYITDVIDAPISMNTERQALINSRIGQGRFRLEVLQIWDFKCAVTKCDLESILIASHIKPWAECETDSERLCPENGLALIPNIDKLFDQGYISFDDFGNMIFSDRLDRRHFDDLDLAHKGFFRPPSELNKHFLHYHRLKFGFDN
jgi:hypothetical protein